MWGLPFSLRLTLSPPLPTEVRRSDRPDMENLRALFRARGLKGWRAGLSETWSRPSSLRLWSCDPTVNVGYRMKTRRSTWRQAIHPPFVSFHLSCIIDSVVDYLFLVFKSGFGVLGFAGMVLVFQVGFCWFLIYSWVLGLCLVI